MKSLRICLLQTKAAYKKEETVVHKMTYPLPHPSTVIGAIRTACGYREYHSIDISIQGDYESMQSNYKITHMQYNSAVDGRGILIKTVNDFSISNAYVRVAKATSRESKIKNKDSMIVYNQEMYKEYLDLQNQKKEISKKNKEISEKSTDKNKDKEEIKKQKEILKTEKKELDKKLEKFRLIEKIPNIIDELNQIKLVIHVSADQKVLEDIKKNVFNIKSLGRSEDFVNILSADIVELTQNEDAIKEIYSNYHAYINYDDIKNENIVSKNGNKIQGGTKYYLNKNYEIIDSKRIFQQVKAIWTSEYKINKFSDTVYIDEEARYIVNFL